MVEVTTPQKPEQWQQTPLLKAQTFIACIIEVCEAININVLFPFLAFMVEDLGHGGSELGYYAGGLAGAFCAAQFCSSILWGWVSDRYGRKPAILFGTLGTAFGMLIFGASKTYTQAIIGRLVSGFLCGNLGVVKSFLTEITDDTNRGKAFSLFSLSWSIGTVIAPITGGFLCKPADKYPSLFSQSGLFGYYPYLLPCLLCCIFNLVTSVIILLVMVETRAPRKPGSGGGSSSPGKGSGKQIEMTVTTTGGRGDNRLTGPAGKSQKFTILADDDDEGEDDDEDENGGNDQQMGQPALPARIGAGIGGGANHSKAYAKLRLLEEGGGRGTGIEGGDEEDDDAGSGGTDDEASSTVSASPLHILTGPEDLKDIEAGGEAAAGSDGGSDDGGNGDGDSDDEDEALCCVASGSSRQWCACLSSRPALAASADDCGAPPMAVVKPDMTSSANVLRQRTVVLVTTNYGVLAMGYIILEETIPLFLKLDSKQGGFSFDSMKIGILLSISGVVMFFFTLLFLPVIAKRSKKWMMQTGCTWAIPLAMAWPLLAMLDTNVLANIRNATLRDGILWPLLITLSVAKSVMACFCFTAVMLQVNHSVHDEHLGAVNGLGQSLASLSRAVGPALGGFLWSMSIEHDFVFFNFIATGLVLLAVIYINHILPISLDKKKMHRGDKRHRVGTTPVEMH